MTYLPEKPYVYKEGRMRGMSMARLMFENYSFLHSSYLSIKDINPTSEKEKHLKWIIERGENRPPLEKCKQCYVLMAVRFLVSYSKNRFFVSPNLISCDRSECKKKLMDQVKEANGISLNFVFSSMLKIIEITGKESSQMILSGLYKEIFNIPKNATDEDLFKFFLEGSLINTHR